VDDEENTRIWTYGKGSNRKPKIILMRIFITYIFHQILQSDQINEEEIFVEYTTHRTDVKPVNNFNRKP
jgi:hypothetical protein